MQRITRGCVLGFRPPYFWMTLSCVALCRWVQSTHGQEDIQLSVSHQRICISQTGTLRISVCSSEKEAPEGSQPRRAGQLRLWCACLCIWAGSLQACRTNDDRSAFCTFRMSLLVANQWAAPVWRHLRWMTHPQSLCRGRKVSQETFLHPPPP